MESAADNDPAFVRSFVQLYGAPLLMLVDRQGVLHARDQRPELGALLDSIGPASGDRVPRTLQFAIRAHFADGDTTSSGMIALLEHNIVVGLPALDPNVEIFPCWLWQIARTSVLSAAGVRYGMSTRELQILEQIIAGVPSTAIATKLKITKATVEWHTKRLLVKTRSKNRTQMTSRVLGWIGERTVPLS